MITYSRVMSFIKSHIVESPFGRLYPIISDISENRVIVVDYNNEIFLLDFEGHKHDKQLEVFIKTLNKYSYVCQNCGKITYPLITDMSYNSFSITDINQKLYNTDTKSDETLKICQLCMNDRREEIATKFIVDPDKKAMFEEYYEISIQMSDNGRFKKKKNWLDMAFLFGIQQAAQSLAEEE